MIYHLYLKIPQYGHWKEGGIHEVAMEQDFVPVQVSWPQSIQGNGR
jgi:hypothetical protein